MKDIRAVSCEANNSNKAGKVKNEANWVTSLNCQKNETGHYLETCTEFQKLNSEMQFTRLSDNKRCFKCAKRHKGNCPFPKKCNECEEDHHTSLHKLAKPPTKNPSTVLCSGVGARPKMDYEHDILINIVPLILHGPKGMLDTYGVFDECAERTMILQKAVNELQISDRVNLSELSQ